MKQSMFLKQIRMIYRKCLSQTVLTTMILFDYFISFCFCFFFFFRIKRQFLSNIIQAIQRSKTPDDAENLRKVEACIYIDALITYFKQVNHTRLNSAVRLQPISEVTVKLDTHIKKKFSQPNGYKL